MNLNEIAELSYNQLSPKSGDEQAIDVVEFRRTAYTEFAFQTLMASYREKQAEGNFEVPSYLSTEVEKEVKDNEMDISDLKVFKSLPQDVWLQQIGDGCDCKYVKSTINLSQLLCDDDSLPDTTRTYYVMGNKIKFPKGAHTGKLSLTYANMGETAPGWIEVDEAIASLIRDKLNQIYLGKVAPEDQTNNSNSGN